MVDNFSFAVVLEPQPDGGFTVLVPALPEVVTEGDTEQEALANAEEAIRAVLSYRRDNGIAVPEGPRQLRRQIQDGIESLERGEYKDVEDADLDRYLGDLGSRS